MRASSSNMALSFPWEQRVVEESLASCQRLREEKEAAEVQLFRDHTLRQRELRQKLEEEYQKEELLLQGKLAEGLRNIHRSFAERERQSEIQLTQNCLPSPVQGRRSASFDKFRTTSSGKDVRALPASRYASPAKPYSQTPRHHSHQPLPTASKGSTPLPNGFVGDLAAKLQISGPRADQAEARPLPEHEPQEEAGHHNNKASSGEESSVETVSDHVAPAVDQMTNTRRVKPRLLEPQLRQEQSIASQQPRSQLPDEPKTGPFRKQGQPVGMNDRKIQQLERQQIAAEAEDAATDQDVSSIEGIKKEERVPDLVQDECRSKVDRQSWHMLKQMRGGPKRGYGRVITRKLWEAGGNDEVDLSSIPASLQLSEKQLPEEQPTVGAAGISTNLLDLWTEDVRLGIPVMELWGLKLQDKDVVRTCVHDTQQLFKNRKKMLRLLRLPDDKEAESDSESASSSSANEFGIRGPTQTAETLTPALEEDEDEVLPLWTFDPAQALPGDLEELSEDEEGRIANERPGFQDPVPFSENLREEQSRFPTPEESESTIKSSWQQIAELAGLPGSGGGQVAPGGGMVAALTQEAMQRCKATVGKQHFSGEAAFRRGLACVAVKLEAMAHGLETAKSKWQSKVLPKLQRKDSQRWQARQQNLPKWQEEQSHIKGRLFRDALEILFATSSQRSLIQETLPSFQRRCGTLEITLHDILMLNHCLEIAALKQCPPEVSISPQPPQKRRKLDHDIAQQKEERQSEGSMSEDDSWLVDDMPGPSEGGTKVRLPPKPSPAAAAKLAAEAEGSKAAAHETHREQNAENSHVNEQRKVADRGKDAFEQDSSSKDPTKQPALAANPSGSESASLHSEEGSDESESGEGSGSEEGSDESESGEGSESEEAEVEEDGQEESNLAEGTQSNDPSEHKAGAVAAIARLQKIQKKVFQARQKQLDRQEGSAAAEEEAESEVDSEAEEEEDEVEDGGDAEPQPASDSGSEAQSEAEEGDDEEAGSEVGSEVGSGEEQASAPARDLLAELNEVADAQPSQRRKSDKQQLQEPELEDAAPSGQEGDIIVLGDTPPEKPKCRRSMDHRNEEGEVFVEILSDVDSDSEEEAEGELAGDEPQSGTPPAEPPKSKDGEPEDGPHSGWIMRQKEDSQKRRAASPKKLEASLAEAAEEAAESQMEDDSAAEAADSEPEEEAAEEAGVSDKEANKENEQAASRRPGRKRGRQRHETAKDQPLKKKRPAQKRPFEGNGSCENSSQMEESAPNEELEASEQPEVEQQDDDSEEGSQEEAGSQQPDSEDADAEAGSGSEVASQTQDGDEEEDDGVQESEEERGSGEDSGSEGESEGQSAEQEEGGQKEAANKGPAARRKGQRRRKKGQPKVDKREAARRAAETRRQNAVDKRNEMYRRALEQQNMREEQREQMREAEGESDEDYEIEPGYTALMTKTKQWQIDENLAKILKEHQWDGIRHMWWNVVIGPDRFKGSDNEADSEEEESEEEETEEKEEGGCILAHSMGLGKTLQTIAFLHTYHHHFPDHHSLLVLPKNVMYNWMTEFEMWLGKTKPSALTIDKVFMVMKDSERVDAINKWSRTPSGVLLVTYEMFTNLTELTRLKKKLAKAQVEEQGLLSGLETYESVYERLNTQEGDAVQARKQLIEEKVQVLNHQAEVLADVIAEQEKELKFYQTQISPLLLNCANVVVADEGHVIKNPATEKARALMRIKTKKRVALTGYPLQNRLIEYYTMVDWVQKGLLPEEEDFKLNFVAPITLGQKQDASQADWHEMQTALSVVQDIVKGCVHRVGPDLLEKQLPKRHEFAIFFQLHSHQEALYKAYLEVSRPYRQLFKDREILRQLCNSPNGFVKMMQEVAGGNTKALKNVVEAVCAQADEMDDGMVDINVKSPSRQQREKASKLDPAAAQRLLSSVPEDCFSGDFQTPKLEFIGKMIKAVVAKNEKIVIFSSSLDALADVKLLLQEEFQFSKNKDFFQLDGTTQAHERKRLIKRFAEPDGPSVFLLSTKAGSLGINLVAANRMIVIDEPWNPVHNAQAVARIFRYGQVKETYIYRLVWDQTMEYRTYRRNLDKEGLARRVIDKKNMRGINTDDDTMLYHYKEPDPSTDPSPSLKVAGDAGDSLLLGIMKDGSLQKHSITLVEDHQETLKDDPTLALTEKQKRRAARGFTKRMLLKFESGMGGGDAGEGQRVNRRSVRMLQKRHKLKAQRIDSSSEEDEVEDQRGRALPGFYGQKQITQANGAALLKVHNAQISSKRPPGFRRTPRNPAKQAEKIAAFRTEAESSRAEQKLRIDTGRL